jgi:hypothetical protein
MRSGRFMGSGWTDCIGGELCYDHAIDELTPDEVEASVQQRAYFNNVAVYQGKVLDASATYNQIIVLGGYAALFAVWSAVATDIPKWSRLVAGGFIMISVIVYVGWAVANMVLMRMHVSRLMAEIGKGPTDFAERVHAAEAKGVQQVAKVIASGNRSFGLPALRRLVPLWRSRCLHYSQSCARMLSRPNLRSVGMLSFQVPMVLSCLIRLPVRVGRLSGSRIIIIDWCGPMLGGSIIRQTSKPSLQKKRSGDPKVPSNPEWRWYGFL